MTKQMRQRALWYWMPALLAAAVALAGYFGPWVPHRAGGLVILGLDLAEYVKFMPAVASGQVALRREIFYLPLVAASVTASLLASRRSLPWLVRWGLAAGAIPVALAMLPPAWNLDTFRTAEFRPQIAAIGVCLLLAFSVPTHALSA